MAVGGRSWRKVMKAGRRTERAREADNGNQRYLHVGQRYTGSRTRGGKRYSCHSTASDHR